MDNKDLINVNEKSQENNYDNKRKEENKNAMYYFKEWGIPILAAIAIATLINKFIFFNIKVPTESMYPTIMPKDRIVVTRIHNFDKIKRKDILVFHSDELGDNGKGEDLIKRLIGLPGDKVERKEDGSVYVNGVKQEEKYVINDGGNTGEFKVPEGKYLFMGDNRANSLDSRYWKEPYIDKKKIMGKAQFIISPFSRIGKLK